MNRDVRAIEEQWLAALRGRVGASVPEEEAHELVLKAALGVFEAAMDAILVANDERRCLMANSAACRMLRIERQRIIGKLVEDITPPHLHESMRDLWDQLQRRGELHGELELLRGDGSTFPAEFSATAGFVPGLHLGILRDVSERARVEQELSSSNRRLQEAQALANVGTWFWDPTAGRGYWSEQLFRIFGLEPGAEAPAWDEWMECVLPEDRVRVSRALEEAGDSGRPIHLSIRIRRPDGELRFLDAHGSVKASEDGSPTSFFGAVQDATDLRRTETELDLRAQLLDQVPAAVVATDRERRISHWNRTAEKLFGWPRDEAVGQTAAELQLTDPQIRHLIWTSMQAGSPWRGKLTYRRQDGTLFPAWSTISPLHDAAGALAGEISVCVDLTEQERTEQEMQETREMLRAVVDGSASVVSVKDRAGRHMFVNRRFGELLGLDADEALGRTAEEILPPQIAAETRASDRKVLESGQPATEEQRFALGERGTHIFLTQRFPLHDAGGEIFGVCGVSTDITDSKRYEAALRARAERQAAIAALGRMAIADVGPGKLMEQAVSLVSKVLDVDATMILELRSQSTSLTVRAAAGFDGEGIDEETVPAEDSHAGFTLKRGAPVFVSDYASESRFTPQPLLQRHRMRSGLSVVIAGKGRAYGVLSAHTRSARTFTGDEGNFLQSVANVLAAAIERERADQLEAQLHQTQRLEAVGQLAGGIAHDFNNLLSIILNFADFLVAEASDERTRSDLEEIREAADRAAQLTHQLLVFSRREMVNPQLVRFAGAVQSTNKLLRRTLGEHIELDTPTPDGLWPVRLGPGQAEQILLNLSLNSRDAMPDGGRLSIRAHNLVLPENGTLLPVDASPGRYVVVSVSDTGTGMEPAVVKQALDPFFTTKPKGKGTGLGLATVYGIAKQAGGDVRIESRPGHGTTVSVYLPAADEAEPTDEPSHDAAPQGSGQTILVVEDEQPVRLLAERILRDHGYRVLSAGDGKEALGLCEGSTTQIDLLLTDVVMPRMSGAELSEKLRESRPELRTLYMSGYGGEVLSSQGFPGNGAVLYKPFRSDSLLTAVSAALERDGGHPAGADGS